MRHGRVLAAATVVAGLTTGAATAQQGAGSSPSTQQNPIPGPGRSDGPSGTGPSPGEPGFTTGLFSSSRTNLLGDIYGLRPLLGTTAISLGLQETSEVFGNVTGGVHRGRRLRRADAR